MFALLFRVLLLFVALLFSGQTPSAVPAHQPSPASLPTTTAVLFDFSKPVPEPLWEALSSELEQNAAPAWPERSVTWMKRQQFQKGMEYPEVIQVRLRGYCDIDLPTDRQSVGGPLGWVYMYTVNGEIQPIAYVNCDQIRQMLEHELRGTSSKERQQKFARAISRIVAHELSHIFQQNAKHSPSGLQRARLTPGELINEGR